jgi:uncharacterized membrane protein
MQHVMTAHRQREHAQADKQQSQKGAGDTATTILVPSLRWFSLALGAGQLAAPGLMAKLIGLRDTGDARMAMRLVGLRELAVGAGLLSGTKPAGWLGARAGGDLLDLALLGSALGGRHVNRTRLYGALAAVAGVTALDAYGTYKASRQDAPYSPTRSSRHTPTTKTIVVNREPEDVYQFWLNFEQFPRFMKHLKQVSVTKDGHSHWKARGPGGNVFAWDAEVVETRPNELIRWRSLPGADVDNEGSVHFERAPGGRGTLVRVNLRYDAPGGSVGEMVATLFGKEPGQEVQEDLRRFKQVIETGEVVLSDASVHGRSHPARPLDGPFRLPKQVPGAGPVEPTHTSAQASDADWPQPDERPTRRSEADDVATMAARGGAR